MTYCTCTKTDTTSSSYSLSGLECNLVVLLSVALVDGLKVEGVREEVVYEGAERGPVRPTGGEVLDLDTLRKSLRLSKTSPM